MSKERIDIHRQREALDTLLEAVRCITPRGDIRLSCYPGGSGSWYATYLLKSGEIARIYIDDGRSSVTLGFSPKPFGFSNKVLDDIIRALKPNVNPRTDEERLRQWQIARGFTPGSLNTDPDRFEIPSYLTINPDYTGRFNEVLRSAPTLIDKVREVANGSREGIGRFNEGGESFDGYRGLPELVSTALFVDGEDTYVLRRPQVIPGTSNFILAGYERKKRLEIREPSRVPIFVDQLHEFGYPMPYTSSPNDKRDFTVIYNPENDGFPCLYNGGSMLRDEMEKVLAALREIGLDPTLVSPVFPFPERMTRNQGLVFLGVGGRYPLGIHAVSITPAKIK